jgi:outer membrane protein assembly factor BamC
LAITLAGCSAIDGLLGGEKVDYKSAGTRTAALDVPPDLTQIARDPRSLPQGGAVSASSFRPGNVGPAATAVGSVAATDLGAFKIVRLGNERWLATPLSAAQLWPQLEQFWKDRGLALVVNQPALGLMETDWAENRAKLPQDFLRATLGRLIEPLYSTGERDKYRARVEATASGSEVFISHRGLTEVYANEAKDSTVWRSRPSDPGLEAEILATLLVKFGAKPEEARATVATAATAAARARILQDRPAATLQVDDGFDRAWRRVGIALDRTGFTVEDRDRNQGLYFVRYVDPSQSGKDEPGFFSKLFSFGNKDSVIGPVRYRLLVKAEGSSSIVTVQDNKGAAEAGEAGKRIVKLLLEELK